ncbi:MAG TPA: hypothetical protein PK659_10110 [Methanothrix sp.]|nr:hypothetical protein [Methanothrix sp.]HOL44595.1 hypothetical protein [Methanothrix sp.]
MKYRVLQPFNGGKKIYRRGEILKEDQVKSWKNLKSLVVTGYLDPIAEDEDEIASVPEK